MMNATNTKFGKIENNRIVYAPYKVSYEGKEITCPNEATYNALGYYRIAITPPTPPEGQRVASTTYAIVDGKLIAQYTYEPIPPAPKVYKVEEIIYGIIASGDGKLAAVKAIVGDAWELFTMRDVVDASNEIWATKFPLVKAALIEAQVFTAEQIDAILAEAEVAG